MCVCVCYLGPCIYLGPSLQQQSHHVAVPTFGSYVQRRDVILGEKRSIVVSSRRTDINKLHLF